VAACSACQRWQLGLCVGHMRLMHSELQKRAVWHLEHFVIRRRWAPQPMQHTVTTSG